MESRPSNSTKTAQEKARANTKVFEIFGEKFDADVIQLILEECAWDEEDTITKLLQLDLDTKSAKRQPEPLGLDIIACDLLSSEFGGATHSQSLEQSAADTGSEAGRPTDSSFGDQHHGSSHRDALSPRGVHSLESDPRDKMDNTDGKDSQRVLSQSDVSGADLQSADQPLLLENPTALSTPGLQSGSEHLVSEETFQSRQDQGEKLPGIALPSAGFTTSPSVQAVSCSRVSNLTSETWSVSNPSCSGKITSGSLSAIQSLSVNAPEFRPTSLSMQSPDMTASGNTPQMYMPVVETPVPMVGSGQYNLPAYQPGLTLAHVPGGTVPYMAQPVVRAQFTPAVGQVAACAPVGMNLYQPQHFPYFPQPPVNPSFCQAHWSTAPVAEQQRLLTAQRFVGPATTPAPATTMRHIPMQAVPDPLTIRPQINKASSSKDMGAYSEKLKKGNPIRVSYPEKLVKEAVTQASTGNISEMIAHLVERIKQYEERKEKVLVIMRGLPGSGKSYLAKKIQGSGEVFSTDDFFMQEGVYKFASERLPVAHQWNQKRVQNALDKAVTPAIVDNTNIELWEMLPYGKMAHLRGYTIEIVEPDTPWNFKPSHLAKLNTHKVSVESIRKMKARYEPISLPIFMRKVKECLRSLNRTSAVEKQPQEKGPVDSSSYARPGVQEKQPGGRGPMKNSPDPPDPQFKRNPKHGRKGPKTDSQVVRVTNHCLSQLKAGASKEELDALIYLSNLGEKEQREIRESLRKFEQANVGKKDVDEKPRVFADVEKFSRESRSVAAGEKSSRGARKTGEKTATDCEATDWGLAAEQRDQQMGAGRRADPRRADSAQSWVTPHPQRVAKGNVAAEAEPQAGELGWTSLVTEDRGPASAHSLTWHSPLPHRRLNEQILKSLKGRKLGEESVDEKSSSKSAGSGFREPAGERTSWASWGSQWLVEDASSWQASSKFKRLDQQESYSKTELSGTGQSQSEAETQNAGEVSVKSKMSGKTTELKKDVDSGGEPEDRATKTQEAQSTELKKDVGSGGEPEDRATKTQEAQSSKASNQSHMGVEAVQELSRQPGEESVSSSEAFPFRQEAEISVSDVSELPEAECGSEVLKHGRGNLEKSAILSVQAKEQVDSAASVTEAERDREPGFSLASGGEGNVLQVHTAATVSGAAVDAKPEPLTFSGTQDDSSSSSSAKSGLSSQTGDKASTESREALQTGSSRKKRVKKHKMPHEPFLQDSAKQLLNSDNWKTFEPEKLIPGAERSAVTGQGPGDGLSIKAGITDQEKIEKNHCHTETQTEGKDFGILLKATTRDLEEGYKVMKPNNHFVSSENHFFTAQRWRISFDKSTNLDMPVKPSVDEMHTLFPDAAEAHLNEVLEVCHGDVDLAIDLMFEWGITTPLTARDKQHLLRETSFPSLTEGRPVPGLLDLCMELLPRLGVDSHRLQQLIITSSQQRLKRLETCEYRRLSSINAESNKESPPEGFVEELQPSFDLLAFTPSECGV